jgi:hypothetical protein
LVALKPRLSLGKIPPARRRPRRDLLRICRHRHARGGARPPGDRADLAGKSVDDATNLASGLTLLRIDEVRRPDAKVPVGFVLGQDPVSGSTVRRMRSVRVWVSAGAHIARAPAAR